MEFITKVRVTRGLASEKTVVLRGEPEFYQKITGLKPRHLWRSVKPTQRCAKCWKITKKTLSDRVHHCQHCGHSEDRDINAAQVMLEWARGLELSSSDAESSSATSCGRTSHDSEETSESVSSSMKQLGAKKRQKPQAQT